MTEQKLTLESVNQSPPLELVTMSGGVNTIGRGSDADVVIDETAISRNHCSLFKVEDYWIFTDLGSTNGSWVNGNKVSDGDLALIRHGDTIQLAGVPLRAKLSNNTPSGLGYKVFLFHGREFVSSFQGGKISVGRDSQEYPIEKEDHEDSSAVFSFDDDGVSVTITPSKKGVLLNEKRSIGTHRLSDRDVVKAGEYKVLIVDTSVTGELKPLAMKPQVSSHVQGDVSEPAYIFGAPQLAEEPTLSTTSSFNRQRLEARYKRRGVKESNISNQNMVLIYSFLLLVVCALIFGIGYVTLS